MTSWSLPGVPIKMVGEVDLSEVMSLLTVEVPPIRRLADKRETNSLGKTAKKPCKTVYIWLANSLRSAGVVRVETLSDL